MATEAASPALPTAFRWNLVQTAFVNKLRFLVYSKAYDTVTIKMLVKPGR